MNLARHSFDCNKKHRFDSCILGLCVLGFAARERILSNLQKHPVPQPAPELQKPKPPVAEVPTACLTDPKAAAELVQQDLNILKEQARYMKLQLSNAL